MKLTVPYLSQHQNSHNPGGSCNVTCIAMVLQFYGTHVLPDVLYQWLIRKNLSRHSGYDLAYCFNNHTTLAVDRFTQSGSLAGIRANLDKGHPVIIHGYFTTFGHIIVVTGYDKHGFWVNDPNGEWFSTGYRTDLSGEGLHYSNKLIYDTCAYDGNLWQHNFTRTNQ